ncbi:MAG: GNAT family N-acetyltransferase [Paucibacter sp.]|nr:GNAT family N-acetyltransferase [Roseateles sp.]
MSPSLSLLDNITWNTLTGPHARFAEGQGAVRRFAAGFSPIVGFENPERPDFDALSRCCAPGESFYCEQWSGAAPPGWRVELESRMVKMVWRGEMPAEDAAPDALRLLPRHVPQALDLATRTRPGPFGPRTIELGEYYGLFEGERLLAMAGERMCVGSWREISGVCTEPDRQGQGLARRLVLKLVRRQQLRGETPFLHVMSGNAGARALYERMGFADYREVVVRVIERST